jgi:uncharacterized protein involved in cysteine biosynthesis
MKDLEKWLDILIPGFYNWLSWIGLIFIAIILTLVVLIKAESVVERDKNGN